MNRVEIESYIMVFRLGLGKDICDALNDLATVESTIPDEVLESVIGMMQNRPEELRESLRNSHAKAFRFHIKELVEATGSPELEAAARAMGCFSEAMSGERVFIDPDAELYVGSMLRNARLERAAADELYIWMERMAQKMKEYAYGRGSSRIERPRPAMLDSVCIDSPAFPIGKLLQALDANRTSVSRDALRVMVYRFRPVINELRLKTGRKHLQKLSRKEFDHKVKIWSLTARPRWSDCTRILSLMESIAASEPALEYRAEV